jgi:hypothetical protein
VQERVRAAVQAAASKAGGAKGGDTAAAACAQIRKNLGAQTFDRRFESEAACRKEAAAALKACRAEAKPGSAEFKACVQARLKAGAGAKPAGQAQKACAEMRTKLGAQRFETRFGSAAGCQKEAAAAMKECREDAKPGSAAFKACVQRKLKAGNTGAAKATAQAKQACAQARKQLGAERFEQRFGSAAECQLEAAQAIKDCAPQEKPGTAAFKSCVQQKLRRR